ncbi:hypothetical protein [Absidia glauca]|uniref:Ndc10 domain-containing protein n=1 Tax=Absidia glauca TaxID=4829 RepID=A0A163K6K8_ABSGL|nr:hypothetical protein [Absidia glauca]
MHDRLAAKELSLDNSNPLKPAVAANAFVQVIMMLRMTCIQGSVLMMELHPCHPIRQHSIFSDPAYLSFKRDLLQIESQEHDPAHTLLQQCAPMHSIFQTPIWLQEFFFWPFLTFAPSSPRHHFFASHSHSLYSTTTNERTNERANEQTNERTIGYDDDDDNRDDDDAIADSTTTSCRPKRLFLKFSNNLVVEVANKSIPFFAHTIPLLSLILSNSLAVFVPLHLLGFTIV